MPNCWWILTRTTKSNRISPVPFFPVQCAIIRKICNINRPFCADAKVICRVFISLPNNDKCLQPVVVHARHSEQPHLRPPLLSPHHSVIPNNQQLGVVCDTYRPASPIPPPNGQSTCMAPTSSSSSGSGKVVVTQVRASSHEGWRKGEEWIEWSKTEVTSCRLILLFRFDSSFRHPFQQQLHHHHHHLQKKKNMKSCEHLRFKVFCVLLRKMCTVLSDIVTNLRTYINPGSCCLFSKFV